MGVDPWATETLSAGEFAEVVEEKNSHSTFPTPEECKKLFEKAKNRAENRPAAFGAGTSTRVSGKVVDYGVNMEKWFAEVLATQKVVEAEDVATLRRVQTRILDELAVEKGGGSKNARHSKTEPMLGLIHGPPGTGKSRLMFWICQLFQQALHWTHGVEFLCVAFQNKVALKMGGETMHVAGDVPVGGGQRRTEAHTDIDILYSKNQHLRWLLVDEVGMTGDDLYGRFESNVTDAAVKGPFSHHTNKEPRVFGGYNVLQFGDFFQIAPIPASSAIYLPRTETKSERAKRITHMFWGNDGQDVLNYFVELKVQKRVIDDACYSSFLNECRDGNLSEDGYNFLLGLPTSCCGSALPNARCASLTAMWQQMFAQGDGWDKMKAMECETCGGERERRNRLVQNGDKRMREEPYLTAPYLHRNNEPKCHAMLLRAAEVAKKKKKYILWFSAKDVPQNPAQVSKNPRKLKERLAEFLEFHDQHTAGLPGLTLLYMGMLGRVSEKIAKSQHLTILKHSPCRVVGWELHPADVKESSGIERYLHYMPKVIYVQIDGAEWTIDPKLGQGVVPLVPVDRTWELNQATGAKITRTGFTLVPDYAGTAFMNQGATLQNAIAELGNISDNTNYEGLSNAYVILSRLTRADGLLLLRAFSPALFRSGLMPGPTALLRFLQQKFGNDDTSSETMLKQLIADYEKTKREERKRKKMHQRFGTRWRCAECKQQLPAEVFDAKHKHEEDVFMTCVAMGYWRRCTACSLLHHLRRNGKAPASQRQCERCEDFMPQKFFHGRQQTMSKM